MPLLRKILFYLFTLVYLIVCPILVFYSLGYILEPGAERGLAKSGAIRLVSLPAGATVYMEGRRFTEKTPTTLSGLLPGQYRVTVASKNRRAWSRNVAVSAERAAVFNRILLLPEHWPIRPLSEREFDDFIPMDSGRFFLLRAGPFIQDLTFFDVREKTFQPLPGAGLHEEARLMSYLTGERGEHVLMHAQQGLWGEQRYLWLDPSKEEPLQDVSSLFREKPQTVMWDERQAENLYTLKDGVLSKLDLETGSLYPNFAKEVSAFGATGSRLYLLDGQGFQRMDPDGEDREAMPSPEPWLDVLRRKTDFFEVKSYPKNRLFFLGSRGALVSNKPPFLLAEEGVKGIARDESSGRYLVWTDHKVGILDAESRPPSGIRWLVRDAGKIEQAFWAYAGSHVLFRDGSLLYLMEPADGASPLIAEFFEVKRGSSVYYLEKTGDLYFLEKSTGRLCTTPLVPKGRPDAF